MDSRIKKILSKIWPFSIFMQKINGFYEEISRLNHINEMQVSKNIELKEQVDVTKKNLEYKNIEINRLNSYILEQHKSIAESQQKLENMLLDLEKSRDQVCKLQQDNTRMGSLLEVAEARTVQYNSEEFWESIYQHGGNSGTGSYGHLAEFKAQVVNNFLNEKRIETAIELGCGDGNQLSLLRYKNYIGVDVSPYVVDKNKERFANDDSKQFYCTLTERDKYIYNKYDVSISMDVIFHLLEDEVYASYMDDLFSLSKKYVIIYSSNHEEFTKWPEYRHRKFMGYVQKHITGWELEQFIPNKYPYVIGHESETSSSDFYIFKRSNRI